MIAKIHPDDVIRTTPFGNIVQLAYHAPDIKAAAQWFANEIGAGPFYLLRHIKLASCKYRGKVATFDHSSAYGQFGDVMIELIHQHNDAPSPVRDTFKPENHGLHHAAIFVNSVDEAIAMAENTAMVCALDATTDDGTRFVMVDGRAEFGFFLEFYEATAALDKFYAFIKRKSQGWDGAEPLRVL